MAQIAGDAGAAAADAGAEAADPAELKGAPTCWTGAVAADEHGDTRHAAATAASRASQKCSVCVAQTACEPSAEAAADASGANAAARSGAGAATPAAPGE